LSGLVPAGAVSAVAAAPAGAATVAHTIALPTGSADTGSAASGSASGSAASGSSSGSAASGSSQSAAALPPVVELAYRSAAFELSLEQPRCEMPWELLAGIGRVESHNADNGDVDIFGTARHAIYGPALNGTLAGNEVVHNHGGGYQRAEGPMQFMPGTWARYAKPGANPQNLFDAAYAAGNYLCSGGLDMGNPAQRTKAILRYNHSMAYVANATAWAHSYHTGIAPRAAELPKI
jgi:membrane-bound lytic murein transglycosylase B